MVLFVTVVAGQEGQDEGGFVQTFPYAFSWRTLLKTALILPFLPFVITEIPRGASIRSKSASHCFWRWGNRVQLAAA